MRNMGSAGILHADCGLLHTASLTAVCNAQGRVGLEPGIPGLIIMGLDPQDPVSYVIQQVSLRCRLTDTLRRFIVTHDQ